MGDSGVAEEAGVPWRGGYRICKDSVEEGERAPSLAPDGAGERRCSLDGMVATVAKNFAGVKDALGADTCEPEVAGETWPRGKFGPLRRPQQKQMSTGQADGSPTGKAEGSGATEGWHTHAFYTPKRIMK